MDLNENCVICMDKKENPVEITCKHTFCKSCIKQHYNQQLELARQVDEYNRPLRDKKPDCPNCRVEIKGWKSAVAAADSGASTSRAADSREIIIIQKHLGRGKSTKYVCLWTNGARTEEKKRFLEENYPRILKEYNLKTRRQNQARYAARNI